MVGIAMGMAMLATNSNTKQLAAPISASTTAIKEVVLTFDDGPNGSSTEEILTILQRKNVPATFFLIGKNVETYPAIVKEEVSDGEVIGNHTYDHPKNLPQLPFAQVKEELSKTDTAIASSIGVHTKLFRPPYGKISKKLRKELRQLGYTVVMWNVDPQDWNDASTTSTDIVQNVITHLKSRMIIVMHDGRAGFTDYLRTNLITILPTLIDDLKERGYTFVTVNGM